jgi:hypothetical protein
MKYKDFVKDIWFMIAVILLITGVCFGVFAEPMRFTAEEVWSGEAARIIEEREALMGKSLIPQLQVGDRIPSHTAQSYGIGQDMEENEELLVLSISGDKTQMVTKRVREKEVNEERFTPFEKRLLEVLEK